MLHWQCFCSPTFFPCNCPLIRICVDWAWWPGVDILAPRWASLLFTLLLFTLFWYIPPSAICSVLPLVVSAGIATESMPTWTLKVAVRAVPAPACSRIFSSPPFAIWHSIELLAVVLDITWAQTATCSHMYVNISHLSKIATYAGQTLQKIT